MQPISLSRTGTGFITRPCNDPGKHFCAVFVIQRNVKHIPNGTTAVKRWLNLEIGRAESGVFAYKWSNAPEITYS